MLRGKNMPLRLPALLIALLLAVPARAATPDLVMLTPQESTMPMARFEQGALTGGMLKDVGDALAQRMGRHATYAVALNKDVKPMLTAGRADLMCHVMPLWIDGDYQWSAPLFPDAEIVAGQRDSAPLASLKDLRDKRVGTVAGYRYPRISQVLGQQFVRVDAPTMEQNLQAMVKGSVPYTILSEATLAYMKRNNTALNVQTRLVFAAFKTQCAVSRKSRVPFLEINNVLDEMVRDGTIDQIVARYR
jgi:ABC-type amino acid transport substrate-binding protein